MMRGPLTAARAMPKRCCSPPDRRAGQHFFFTYQANFIQCRADSTPHLRRWEFGYLQGQGQIRADVTTKQELMILEYGTDLAAVERNPGSRQSAEISAVDDYFAGEARLQCQDEAQQGAFARTGVPGEEYHFAFINFKVDVGQCI